jgi:lipoate-protein ligase A
MTCRILIDAEPAAGAWNMAVDEFLLELAIEAGTCGIRTYQWREPTVSLGHFQSADSVGDNPRLAGLPVVRRLSGGGAILHHHEVTYSCAVPAGHPAIRNPTDLYETAHAAVIRVLAEAGVTVGMRGEVGSGDEAAFLCFSRGDPRDIVLQGQKIVGSAQRRRRGAVLQHGSVLLQASEFAPEYPGLVELAGWERPASELAARIAHALAGALSESGSVEELRPEERRRVGEFV